LCWTNFLTKDNFTREKIVEDLKDTIKVLSRQYLLAERGFKKEYMAYIIKLKKEAGLNNK